MRQVMINELSRADIDRLREWLGEHAEASELDGLYWVALDPEMLEPDQAATEADHPFCSAVEVGEDWAAFELLIRSRSNMRSPLTRYANARQRAYITDLVFQVVEELNLHT